MGCKQLKNNECRALRKHQKQHTHIRLRVLRKRSNRIHERMLATSAQQAKSDWGRGKRDECHFVMYIHHCCLQILHAVACIAFTIKNDWRNELNSFRALFRWLSNFNLTKHNYSFGSLLGEQGADATHVESSDVTKCIALSLTEYQQKARAVISDVAWPKQSFQACSSHSSTRFAHRSVWHYHFSACLSRNPKGQPRSLLPFYHYATNNSMPSLTHL